MAIYGDNAFAYAFRDPMTPELMHTQRTLKREHIAELKARLVEHSRGFGERTHLGASVKTRFASNPLISGKPHFPELETGHIMNQST